jgi:hypothetical protein
MLPGFEALGAASALLQVIFFAEGLVSQYKLAYNGNHTPDDDLEDRAKQMIDASLRVQSHCKAIGSPMKEAETKLCDVAGECHAIAEKLASEVHNITGIQSKGKMSKSLLATYLSLKNRKFLKRLEASLQNHKQLMETQLLFRLW